jgi:hypothetical protein
MRWETRTVISHTGFVSAKPDEMVATLRDGVMETRLAVARETGRSVTVISASFCLIPHPVELRFLSTVVLLIGDA